MFKNTEDFGKIKFLTGPDKGRYPFCNTLFIDDEIKTIIDPGCSNRRLRNLTKEVYVQRIILSHYHEDHTQGLSNFDTPDIFIHEMDLEGVKSVEGLMKAYGVKNTLDSKLWLNFLVNGLGLKDQPKARSFDEKSFDFGKIRAEIIHTPGHTPGHICLLFPEQELLFTADLDLTSFGPYYGDDVSDLEQSIASLNILVELSPKVLLTGHTAGVVTENIKTRIIKYRDIIFQREDKILSSLKKPISTKGLVKLHLIYGKQYEPRTIFDLIEMNMIQKHLTRLLTHRRIESIGEDLFVAL